MSNIYQTLIVHPDTSFITIENNLKKLGWKCAPSEFSVPSLIKDEPESMTWEWAGGKPFITYTFNPVAKLRVLDVATLTPAQRGEIAQSIPIVNDKQLDAYFKSNNPREKLLALWAVNETERLKYINAVSALHNDGDVTIAKESRRISQKFIELSEKRTEVLATLRLVANAAENVIHDIHNEREWVSVLMPTREDCKVLFDEHLAPAVFNATKKAYETLGNLDIDNTYYHMEVMATHGGLLRWSNELSDHFPRGYRDVAAWMKPNNIWLSWAWVKPLEQEETREKGLAYRRMPRGTFSQSKERIQYDGLAWVDDHWVWLPKLHRVLIPLIQKTIKQAECEQPSAAIH